MVSVPKRLHKRANVRNLLNRRMREAYRLNKEPLREICIRENIRLSLGLLYTSGEIADYKTYEHKYPCDWNKAYLSCADSNERTCITID